MTYARPATARRLPAVAALRAVGPWLAGAMGRLQHEVAPAPVYVPVETEEFLSPHHARITGAGASVLTAWRDRQVEVLAEASFVGAGGADRARVVMSRLLAETERAVGDLAVAGDLVTPRRPGIADDASLATLTRGVATLTEQALELLTRASTAEPGTRLALRCNARQRECLAHLQQAGDDALVALRRL